MRWLCRVTRIGLVGSTAYARVLQQECQCFASSSVTLCKARKECVSLCAALCSAMCACVCLCVCWADNDPTQQHTWDDPTQIYYPRGQEEHLAPAHAVRFVVMRNSTYKLIYRVKGSTPGGGPDRCVIVRPIPADPRPTTPTPLLPRTHATLQPFPYIPVAFSNHVHTQHSPPLA